MIIRRPGSIVRMTAATKMMLLALATADTEETFGRDIMRRTGLKSSTVYPILARFAATGWITYREETDDELPKRRADRRPRRRYVRLTDTGKAAANEYR